MARYVTRRPRGGTDEHKKAWFWAQTKITAKGCWDWQRSVDTLGYGCFYWEGRVQRAHRIAWLFTSGSLPELEQVLHHCDNRKCINPAHLYLGTRSENMMDKSNRGRCNAPRGERHPFAKLTNAQADEARALRKTGMTYQAIGERYGVGKKIIWRLVTGTGYQK